MQTGETMRDSLADTLADIVGRHCWTTFLTSGIDDRQCWPVHMSRDPAEIVGRQCRPSKMTFDTAQQCRPSTLTRLTRVVRYCVTASQ